jgi:hypothetical protein
MENSMKPPKRSPRPKANPFTQNKRPRTRSDKEAEDEADAAADRAMKHSQPPTLVYKAAGGKVKKMAMGGMCRGMGAAKKGGKYKE